MADELPEIIATSDAQIVAETGHGGAPTHASPELFGLAPFQIVAVAMLVLLFVFIWKKVPALVLRGIDSRIETIRQQLDDAKALRAEAEALRAEYEAKIAGAEKDAEMMIAGAHAEAERIVAQAETDSKEMVARRERMAADKIAAAEREAVDSVRRTAATAATIAASKLISQDFGETDDRKLADEIIAGI